MNSEENGLRLLVSGGCGFIGTNFVRTALEQGHRVCNLDALTYAGNRSSLRDVEAMPGYRFHRVDIRDLSAVRATVQDFHPEAVVHLAAESHVDRSIDGPSVFIETNVIGTYHMLQASLEHWHQLDSFNRERFRFLHVSTDEVYGSLGSSGRFNESTAYDPHSPYSASKASSDHLARAWHVTYGLPVIVSNCSNNYGPFQYPEKLIPVVILKCLRNEPIPIYGKGENIRDWLHVSDHCGALLAMLRDGKPGETYNVGSNNEQSNIQLVRMLCRIMDDLHPNDSGPHEDRIRFVPDRPGHDLRYAIDSTKIRVELGWKPKAEFAAELRTTVKWYLENQSWWQEILSGGAGLDRRGLDGGGRN